MPSWFPYYIYCENHINVHDFQMWNFWTNLIFFAVGFWVWRQHALPRRVLLTALFAVSGALSFVWHLTAAPLALLGDMAGVFVLMTAIVWVAFETLLGWRRQRIMAAVGAFLVACAAFKILDIGAPALEQDSGAFIPAVLLLAGMGWHMRRHCASALMLAGGAASLALAIAARSEDLAFCPFLPMGTHFIWHLASVGAAFLALYAIRRFAASATP